LKHIVLTGEGRVTLFAEGPAGHSPVQRAGLVLLALTPEAQLPMQLRLLILEEVSPRPKLSALQDLHRELEFFERPDRQTVVREVYERFQRELSETTAAAIVPQPLLEPPPPKRHHLWWKRRSVWVGGWLVLMAMAAAAMMWVWPRPEGQWMRVNASQLSQASMAAGEKATQAVRREVDAAKWYLGFRPREPEPSVPVLAYAGPSNPPQPAPAVQMQGVVAPPEVPSFQLSKAQLSGTPEPIPAPAAVGPSGMVYSARDNQVVPPSLIKPQLSKSTPAGVRVEDGPELELVVSATGEVDSVKLVSASPGTQAGMKLSAVKAWRFEPATRNGQPVRYRLRVRLPAQ
jgi:hypothetical protein